MGLLVLLECLLPSICLNSTICWADFLYYLDAVLMYRLENSLNSCITMYGNVVHNLAGFIKGLLIPSILSK